MREVHAELDVVGGQKRGRGDGQRADAAQGQHGHPVFHAPVEDEHDPVALFDAPGGEGAGELHGLLLEEAEGELAAFSGVVHVDHGQAAFVLCGARVQEVVGEVVVLGHFKVVGRHEIAIAARAKFFQHGYSRVKG